MQESPEVPVWLFTQPPMRRMRMFYRCFFLYFFLFRPSKNTRQPFSGTAERIFMKLLPNDSGNNVVSNVILKWGLGPQIIFGGLKLHIAHLVVTPGE